MLVGSDINYLRYTRGIGSEYIYGISFIVNSRTISEGGTSAFTNTFAKSTIYKVGSDSGLMLSIGFRTSYSLMSFSSVSIIEAHYFTFSNQHHLEPTLTYKENNAS